MKPMKVLISLLFIACAPLLSGCGGVEVKDTTVWSYLGQEIEGVAALGSHTNFQKRETKTLDEWIDFLSPSDKHGPAICMTSEDYAKQKTALEQACVKSNCSLEQKKEIEARTIRIDKHIRKVKALSRTNFNF